MTIRLPICILHKDQHPERQEVTVLVEALDHRVFQVTMALIAEDGYLTVPILLGVIPEVLVYFY